MNSVNCKHLRHPATCMYGYASRRFYQELSCILLDGSLDPRSAQGCVLQEQGPKPIQILKPSNRPVSHVLPPNRNPEGQKACAIRTATVTKAMLSAAHGVTLESGDVVLSARLLERIYLAMEQAAPPPQTPFDPCPTCEALARTVMMDQAGAA